MGEFKVGQLKWKDSLLALISVCNSWWCFYSWMLATSMTCQVRVSTSKASWRCKMLQFIVLNIAFTRSSHNEKMASPERCWWRQLWSQRLPESQHHCSGNRRRTPSESAVCLIIKLVDSFSAKQHFDYIPRCPILLDGEERCYWRTRWHWKQPSGASWSHNEVGHPQPQSLPGRRRTSEWVATTVPIYQFCTDLSVKILHLSVYL